MQYKGLDLKVTSGIAEKYDDNVELSNEHRKEDFITNLSIGIITQYLGKTRRINLTGNMNGEIHKRNSELNNMNGNISVNLQNELSRYDRIGISNDFNRTFVADSFEDELGRTQSRSEINRNNFDITYSREISKNFIVIPGFSNEITRISGDNDSESYQNSFSLKTNYLLSAGTSFLILYDYAKRKYVESSTEFTTNTVALTTRYKINKQRYFDVTLGVDFLKRDNVSDTGEYVSAEFTSEFKNSSFRVSVEKRKRPNIFTEEIVDSWNAAISVSANLLEKLSCSFSSYYGEGKFKSTNVTDKNTRTDIGCAYEIKNNLIGDLGYVYSHKTSTDFNEIRGYDRNLIRSGLSVTF